MRFTRAFVFVRVKEEKKLFPYFTQLFLFFWLVGERCVMTHFTKRVACFLSSRVSNEGGENSLFYKARYFS